jgi:uncharacterized protein YbaP (TraB family)
MTPSFSFTSRLASLFLTILAVATCPLPALAHPLWAIRGSENTVFLMGSVHVLRKDDYPLPPALNAAFDQSRKVVMESDLDALEQASVQQTLLRKAQLPRGETLRHYLSGDTYTQLRAHLSQNGLPENLYDRLQPSVAAIAVQVGELRRLGFEPELGLDRHFLRRARREGKLILPLEPVETQIRLLTEPLPGEAEKLVRSTLDDLPQTEERFTQLLEAWRKGDVRALQQWLQPTRQAAPKRYGRSVVERNRRWLPRILGLLQEPEDAVIVVGVGHLIGPHSLIELLRQQGHEPEQR